MLLIRIRDRIVSIAHMTPASLDYYGIEELLTDEERAARDRARRFVQEEVMPEIVAMPSRGKISGSISRRGWAR